MVLLAGVTLFSVAVAGVAGWLEPVSAANESTPFHVSTAAPSSGEAQPVHLADQPAVRVIGAPFVPNVNPRER